MEIRFWQDGMPEGVWAKSAEDGDPSAYREEFNLGEATKPSNPNPRFTNRVIIVCAVALVLGPIAMPALKQERTKWRLAGALNAVELKSGTFEEKLEQAEEDLGELQTHHDFWVVLVERALIEKPRELPEILREAKKHDPGYKTLGEYVVQELSLRNPYRTAETIVQVKEDMLDETERNHPAHLNHLAYLRALIARDLDLALTDIDKALESFPEDPGLRDTRAWVLYQMGRPVEALEDADFAVQGFEESVEAYQQSSAGWIESVLSVLFAEPSDKDRELSRSEAGEAFWTRGVLRYHRMKILENLGREEEAEADRAWLVEHRLPTDERLN